MSDPDIVLYQLSHYKPLIDRAIKITEDYVSKHKLILTGGMAIDQALRLKGDAIYDDDALPDYDILSDENIMHANNLAEILCNDGFPDINVINAAHVTTMRVRMKSIVLLDATYIPPICFKKIPYLDVNHLRVVHPHYQMIDQRLSLSNLLGDTGRSLNVFHRLTKDIKRNMILRQAYPIESTKPKLKYQKISIPLELIQINKQFLEKLDDQMFIYTGPTCIAGYVGIMIMMAQYTGKKHWTITDTTLDIDIPEGLLVSFLTCNDQSLDSFIKSPALYRPLINLKPVARVQDSFEFVDIYGSRVGCNAIKLNDSVEVCVASVDYLLMELLRDRIYVSKEPSSWLYTELVAMVDDMREKDSHPMWWPSLNCYGKEDLPEYRLLGLERLMDPDIGTTIRPRTSYPTAPKCATRSGFEPTKSHYFTIDGQRDDTITHSSYKYIIDDFRSFADKKRNG